MISQNLRRHRVGDLAWIVIAALILETVVTVLAVRLGHAPYTVHLSAEDALTQPTASVDHEPRDRLALIGWWLSMPVLFAAAIVSPRLVGRRGKPNRWRGGRYAELTRVVAAGCCVLAVAIAVSAALWHPEITPVSTGWIPTISVEQLAIGTAVGIAVVLAFHSTSPVLWRVTSLLLVSVTAAFVIPAFVQTPSSLGEPGHAAYTLDELIAPAVGRIPLDNYIPQYINLLGYPIAPVIRLWPNHASEIAVMWVVLLLFVLLAGMTSVSVLVGGRRFAPVALLAAGAPLVFATDGGTYPAVYFAGAPLRTVLPVITIVVAIAAFGRRSVLSLPMLLTRSAFLGVVAGTAALNNPDHGFPVLLAVATGVLFTLPGWRTPLAAMTGLLLGALLPFALYALALGIAGRSTHWPDLFLFAKMFGNSGYGSVSMPAFGTHVALVAFFCAAAVIGFVELVRRRRDASASIAQWLALAITGLWSLFTLPYYVGRSLPPQLLFGYAVQVGLVTCALLPLLFEAVVKLARFRTERQSPPISQLAAVALGCLVVGSLFAALMNAPTPSKSWTRIAADRPDQWTGTELAVARAVDDPANAVLKEARRSGTLGQLLMTPSLMELRTGIPSLSILNSPVYLEGVAGVLRLQCDAIADDDATWVIMLDTAARELANVQECRAAFDLNEPIREIFPGVAAVKTSV